MLAAANAVTNADLVAGTTLRAPQVTTSANDASTFKPYDPNSILGPTTPSLPYITPPPKPHCNALASVIRIVATVITMIVAPYAAAAVAGIGETMAQTIEIQDGDRQGYNWAQVGTSAIMAGFGASKVGQSLYGGMRTADSVVTRFAGRFAYGATMAVASDAVNYALSKGMGYETHFSLRSTVANGIASGLSTGILGPAPGQGGTSANGPFNWTAVAMAAVKSVARQGISYGVHKAIEGHASWNTGQVLGNAIGDAVGTGLGAVTREQMKASQGDRPELTAVGIEQERFGVDPGTLELLPPPRLSEPAMGGVLSGFAADASIAYGDQRRSAAVSGFQTPSTPHNVETPEQRQYIATLNAYLRERGMTPLPEGASYGIAYDRYQDLVGERKIYNLEPLVVTGAGAYDPVSDPSWWSIYHLLDSGAGTGVIKLDRQNAYQSRTGEMPRFVPATLRTGYPGGVTAAEYHRGVNQQTMRDIGAVWDVLQKAPTALFPNHAALFSGESDSTFWGSVTGVGKEIANIAIGGANVLWIGAAGGMPLMAASEGHNWLIPSFEIGKEEYLGAALVDTVTLGAGVAVEAAGLLRTASAARYSRGLEGVASWSELGVPQVANAQRSELIAEANSRSAYLRGKFGSLTSEQRLARIDELSQANWTRRVDEMINSQDYVFRYLTDSGLQASLKYNSVRGYATTNFSSSSSEVMSGAQIFEQWPGAPFTGPVKYGVAIPVNRLQGFSVARPMGGAGTAGWEVFANSYPAAGAGGYSQFLINSVPLNQTYLFTLRP